MIISEGHEDEDKTRREVLTDHPGKVLREILEAYKSPVVPGLPPFTGGLVGYFSYEFFLFSRFEQCLRFSRSPRSLKTQKNRSF